MRSCETGGRQAKKQREAWIDWIRVFGTLAIVVLHVTAREKVRRAGALSGFDWWTLTVYEALTRIAVPLFFMISGYLILSRCAAGGRGRYVLKRTMRVIAIAALWTLVYSGWEFYRGNVHSMLDLLTRTLWGDPYYHLWFLFALALTYVISPVIAPGLAVLSGRAQVILAWAVPLYFATDFLLVEVFKSDVPHVKTVLLMGVPFAGYTVAGYLLRDKNVAVRPWLPALLYVISLAVTLVLFAALSERGCARPDRRVFYPLTPTVVVMALSAYLVVSRSRLLASWTLPGWVQRFAHDSLGVYIVHPLFLDVVNHFGIMGRRPNALFGIVLTSALVVALTWPVVIVCRKLPLVRNAVML